MCSASFPPAPGTYAVLLFPGRNSNGTMATNLMEIRREAVPSNGAKSRLDLQITIPYL
jgi:uncharacterized protein (DUF2141 family)